MTTVSTDLREAVQEAGDQPVQIVDPETDQRYVLVRAEVYERLQLLFEQEPLSREEQQRLLLEAAKRADWDDPEMDIYNDLAPQR